MQRVKTLSPSATAETDSWRRAHSLMLARKLFGLTAKDKSMHVLTIGQHVWLTPRCIKNVFRLLRLEATSGLTPIESRLGLTLRVVNALDKPLGPASKGSISPLVQTCSLCVGARLHDCLSDAFNAMDFC